MAQDNRRHRGLLAFFPISNGCKTRPRLRGAPSPRARVLSRRITRLGWLFRCSRQASGPTAYRWPRLNGGSAPGASHASLPNSESVHAVGILYREHTDGVECKAWTVSLTAPSSLIRAVADIYMLCFQARGAGQRYQANT